MEITFEKVSYTYQPKTPFAYQALDNVNLQITGGSITAIIGHTGSGKSTLIQHLNGLLIPTEGKVIVGDFVLSDDPNKLIKDLRRQVGMVFQYPEHQLFEETVKKDILFGPRNFNLEVSEKDLTNVMEMVGLNPQILDQSPFELSGGQMRRVAIASVLILNPKVLVLDEPTAGLDPLGQLNMMELFKRLNEEYGMTIVWVTHQMEDVLQYADQVVVMNEGKVALHGCPIDVFNQKSTLKNMGLDVPEIIEFLDELKQTTGLSFTYQGETISDLADQLVKMIKAGGSS